MIELEERFVKKFSEFKDLDIDLIVVEEENGCTFHFEKGPQMTIDDGGQSCCETRWMTCDDDLKQFKGARLTGAELLEGPTFENDEYDCPHDSVFLRIDTTAGSFRLCMHNRHSGYYGGFDPCIAELLGAPTLEKDE